MEIEPFVIELHQRTDGQYDMLRWDIDEQGEGTLVSIVIITAEQAQAVFDRIPDGN